MTLLNNILRRKANWIGYVVRRNCPLHVAIERQVTCRRHRKNYERPTGTNTTN